MIDNYGRHYIVTKCYPKENPLFEEITRKEGLYSEELMRKVAETGSVQHLEKIPEHIKRLFRTTHDISPE